jgi:hypothetical protein
MAAWMIPAVGAASSLFGALGAGKAQKRQAAAAEAGSKLQRKAFHQANPYYQQALAALGQGAGLNVTPYTTPVKGAKPGAPGFGGTPGMASIQPVGGQPPMGQPPAGAASTPGQGNIYETSPEDVYRLQQAEEDIGRQNSLASNALMRRLGQQGIGGSTLGSALTQQGQSAMDRFAQFRRQLAMNATQERQNRLMQLINAAQPGLSMGQQGISNAMGMANMYGQQGQQAAGGIGNAIQSYMDMQMMRQMMQQPGGGYEGGGLPDGGGNAIPYWLRRR